MKVSVIGCGKVGRPMCKAFTYMGYDVIGIDNREGVGDTTDYNAIKDTDITFIIVPTPSKKDNSFDEQYILEVLEKCPKIKNHLFVVNSTTSPGTMDKIAQKYPNICYNPFFIRLPSVFQDIVNPRFILIGGGSKNTIERLVDFYKRWKSPLLIMNFINAELSKLAVNTFMTTKISYFNNLAELCEKFKWADIDHVSMAIEAFYGEKTRAGASYGGPCLPRDNRALVKSAKDVGVDMPIATATDKINERVADRILKMIGNKKTFIVGTNYTLGTDYEEESLGFKLKQKTNSVEDIKDADVVVIAMPSKDMDFKGIKPTAQIIDCWRVLKGQNIKNYKAIGLYGE